MRYNKRSLKFEAIMRWGRAFLQCNMVKSPLVVSDALEVNLFHKIPTLFPKTYYLECYQNFFLPI